MLTMLLRFAEVLLIGHKDNYIMKTFKQPASDCEPPWKSFPQNLEYHRAAAATAATANDNLAECTSHCGNTTTTTTTATATTHNEMAQKYGQLYTSNISHSHKELDVSCYRTSNDEVMVTTIVNVTDIIFNLTFIE